MKTKPNLFFVYFFATLCFILCFSGTKGNWSGLALNPTEIKAGINFQLSRGSTCIAEFKALSSTLNKFITNESDATRLVEVLGNPDAIENSKNIYFLSSNTNSIKAILEIKNNTLIGYHFEKSK